MLCQKLVLETKNWICYSFFIYSSWKKDRPQLEVLFFSGSQPPE